MAGGQALFAPADLAWLRSLPDEFLLTEGVWVCHGMPGNPWNSIWPRSPIYDANVSDADRDASRRMLANVDATPQTLTRSHLRAMHADLLELIVLVFPAQGRQAVESRLRELSTEP